MLMKDATNDRIVYGTVRYIGVSSKRPNVRSARPRPMRLWWEPTVALSLSPL
ncbi:hypothetical protein BD311DRAFT_761550 [Dichomitus squalens]|uniref:Uncharacterized protein n=1 Tax=Dichomitus squalens TaxID=114155 RepID=A0A4Q9MHI9_9APHY|nr:hypothetical protein BD311DRAFT_761550 [Dichomitus squalens]